LQYAIEGHRQARPMRLGVKQRHALAVLAATGPDDVTQPLLTAHGCGVAFDRGAGQPGGITTFTHELVEVARVNFRRAGATLSRLKASGRNDAMQTLLPAHGFGVQVNAGLVSAGHPGRGLGSIYVLRLTILHNGGVG
jgi:hypothetical protein